MTDQIGALRIRWQGLSGRLGLAEAPAAGLFDELAHAYSEPGRHYHTLAHIAVLFELLDRHGRDVRDRDAVELAIFFHDAIYVPARADNEEASAALARDRLTALGAKPALVQEAERLIVATRHGAAKIDAEADPDLALLLDLDLSILAAPRAAYAAYVLAIRDEYAMIPDETYKPGRARVLQGFLRRERIYLTDRLRALWEASARANLAAEIAGSL
jgi:predicted metal-dependent HD superfamily phosphohydrolase